MPNWCHVSPHDPCRICDKGDWCAVSTDGAWALCRRLDTGVGIRKLDKAGAECWLYRLDGNGPRRQPSLAVPPALHAACADAATLDRVYRELLAVLPLASAHRQALRSRGLADGEIVRRRYRTLPLQGRAALAKRLVEQCGAEVCAQVPGFYVAERDGQRWWSFAGAAGLIIPVRTLDGHIVALKVRADDPGNGAKYTSVSSAKHGGPGPGAPVHVPWFDGVRGETIRLTEGELKADVATALSGLLTVSVPGVAMWRKALPALQDLGVQQVLLAFDADWHSNPHVALALAQSAFALTEAGYAVHVEAWEPAQSKGIDDLLAAGHRPTLQSAAMAFGASLRGQSRTWTGRLSTIAAAEVRPWH